MNKHILLISLFQLPLSILVAYIIDILLGDPAWLPHPVVGMGKLIKATESLLRKIFKSKGSLKFAGLLLWMITVGTSLILPLILLRLAFRVHFLLGFVLQSLILWTGLARKTLYTEGEAVYTRVAAKDLEAARTRIGYLVGRDTTKLSFDEIIRAAVETIAENTVDGVTAPLFYATIGGAPLMMAYKAVNTLDSMVGYKNDAYEDLGYFSAKLDDFFNYIPARITLVGFIFAAALLGFDHNQAKRIAVRDHKNHKSPNAGWPEAAMAGALGIQLGGNNVYFGKVVEKPTLGDKERGLQAEDILDAGRIMKKTSDMMLLLYLMTLVVASLKMIL